MSVVRLLAAALLVGIATAEAQSIVERHGTLRTAGNRVVDKDGKPIQLAGMSLYWSQWGSKYYTKGVVDQLVNDWKTPIIRAAMAADSSVGGYMKSPTVNLNGVTKVVEAAIANGIYVIIDWHEEMAINHTKEASAFFEKMAAKYGKLPNVIFEIYNEPHNKDPELDPTWPQIKEYAQTVIAAIRKHSPNLVVVGTPTWSADVDVAAAEPIDTATYGAVAYTLHFYAGTHGASTRSKATDALKQGVPVFATEWGTTNADGGQLTGPSKGKIYPTETATWLSYLEKNMISWCNWSVVDVQEGSAALMPGASVAGKWDTLVDISPSGLLLRNVIRTRCENDSNLCPFIGPRQADHSVPGLIGASRFAQGMSVLKVADADSFHLGSIDSGDWAVYPIVAAAADTFEVRATARTMGQGGTLSVKANGTEVLIPLVALDGAPWTTFASTGRLVLPAGSSSLEVRFLGQGEDSLELRSLELLRNPVRAVAIPGTVPLDVFSAAPTKGALLLDGEPASPALFRIPNATSVSYQVTTAQAGTYTMAVKVAAGGAKAQLVASVTSGFKKTRIPVTLPEAAGWRNWIPTWTTMDLGAGLNTIALIVSGDSTTPLLSLADLRFEQGVGVHRATSGRGAAVHREGAHLRLTVPAGSFQEGVLVAADGRILSTFDLSGRESTLVPAPSAVLPVWIRLRGQSGSRILAVPPTR